MRADLGLSLLGPKMAHEPCASQSSASSYARAVQATMPLRVFSVSLDGWRIDSPITQFCILALIMHHTRRSCPFHKGLRLRESSTLCLCCPPVAIHGIRRALLLAAAAPLENWSVALFSAIGIARLYEQMGAFPRPLDTLGQWICRAQSYFVHWSLLSPHAQAQLPSITEPKEIGPEAISPITELSWFAVINQFVNESNRPLTGLRLVS